MEALLVHCCVLMLRVNRGCDISSKQELVTCLNVSAQPVAQPGVPLQPTLTLAIVPGRLQCFWDVRLGALDTAHVWSLHACVACGDHVTFAGMWSAVIELLSSV